MPSFGTTEVIGCILLSDRKRACGYGFSRDCSREIFVPDTAALNASLATHGASGAPVRCGAGKMTGRCHGVPKRPKT